MVSYAVQVLAAFMLGEEEDACMQDLACIVLKTKQNKNPNRGCLQLFSITALSACNCSMFSIKECQMNECVKSIGCTNSTGTAALYQ